MQKSPENRSYVPFLTRYRIREGKESRLDEWMASLHQHHQECLETMVPERSMKEAVFTSRSEKGSYLYWFTYKAPGGNAVPHSPWPIDQDHMEFWLECIDLNVPRETFRLENYWELPSQFSGAKN